MNQHHTVTLGEWSGLCVYTRGINDSQMLKLWILRSPWNEKWVSSVHKILMTQENSCLILERAHLPNASLSTVFYVKSSRQDCNLHGQWVRTPWKIFCTENGGKPRRLIASRALLVPAADSDANGSICAATRAERVCLRLDHPHLIRSSNDLVSSNRCTSFVRPATVKGPYPVFTLFCRRNLRSATVAYSSFL